jgi:general L-amino acid transport system substrate-binding protein
MSKEPLGPLSPQSDPQWADIIRWTIYGTIQAEEYGITSKNVDDFLKSDVPEIQRFLGQGDNAIGSLYGIKNDFMVQVIKQVGNYGEIFDRNLGPNTPFNLGRGINDIWEKGGLMYAPPFR